MNHKKNLVPQKKTEIKFPSWFNHPGQSERDFGQNTACKQKQGKSSRAILPAGSKLTLLFFPMASQFSQAPSKQSLALFKQNG